MSLPKLVPKFLKSEHSSAGEKAAQEEKAGQCKCKGLSPKPGADLIWSTNPVLLKTGQELLTLLNSAKGCLRGGSSE